MVEKLPPLIGAGPSPPSGVAVADPAEVELGPAVALAPPVVAVARGVLVRVGVLVEVHTLVFVDVTPPGVLDGGKVGVALGIFGIGGFGPPLVRQIAVTFMYIPTVGRILLKVILMVLAGLLK